MKYAIIVNGGYISGLCQSENDMVNEVTEEMFNSVSVMLLNRPHDAPYGYTYKLRADTLEWELVKLPPTPEYEPTEEDKAAAYDIIVSGISEKETPKPLEIAKKIKEIVDKYYKG